MQRGNTKLSPPFAPDLEKRVEHYKCCPARADHIVIRRSIRSVFPQLLLAFVLIAAVVRITLYFDLFDSLPLRTESKIAFSLLGIIILTAIIIRPIILLCDAKHEIACHHLRSIIGRCSMRQTKIELPFEDILGVRVIQNLYDRVFGVGTIVVWTAFSDNPEIEMVGIGAPNKVASLIVRKLDQTRVERITSETDIGGSTGTRRVKRMPRRSFSDDDFRIHVSP